MDVPTVGRLRGIIVMSSMYVVVVEHSDARCLLFVAVSAGKRKCYLESVDNQLRPVFSMNHEIAGVWGNLGHSSEIKKIAEHSFRECGLNSGIWKTRKSQRWCEEIFCQAQELSNA